MEFFSRGREAALRFSPRRLLTTSRAR
jgi:hypothetical protein